MPISAQDDTPTALKIYSSNDQHWRKDPSNHFDKDGLTGLTYDKEIYVSKTWNFKCNALEFTHLSI